MRVLITGAGGYLGAGLIKPFEGRHELRLMDLAAFESEHEVLTGDVADLSACREALEGIDGMVIAHMASVQAGAYEEPPVAFDANVKGTANLFFAAVEQNVRRIVLISSVGAVNGYPADVFRSRDLHPKAKEIYGLTKALQEVIAEQFQREHDLEVAVIRTSWVMDADTMITKYGDRVPHYCVGLTDRRDIGEAARLALELPDLKYEVFYVEGTPESAEKEDLAYTRERLGWTPKYDFKWLPTREEYEKRQAAEP